MAPVVVLASFVLLLHVQWNKLVNYYALVVSFSWRIFSPILLSRNNIFPTGAIQRKKKISHLQRIKQEITFSLLQERTPLRLHEAARDGDIITVRALVQSGENVDVRTSDGVKSCYMNLTKIFHHLPSVFLRIPSQKSTTF